MVESPVTHIADFDVLNRNTVPHHCLGGTSACLFSALKDVFKTLHKDLPKCVCAYVKEEKAKYSELKNIYDLPGMQD